MYPFVTILIYIGTLAQSRTHAAGDSTRDVDSVLLLLARGFSAGARWWAGVRAAASTRVKRELECVEARPHGG